MKYYRKTLRNRKQKKGKTVDKKQKGKKTKTFIKPRELNRLFRKYTKKFLQKGGDGDDDAAVDDRAAAKKAAAAAAVEGERARAVRGQRAAEAGQLPSSRGRAAAAREDADEESRGWWMLPRFTRPGAAAAAARALHVKTGCPDTHPHSVNLRVYKIAAKEAWSDALDFVMSDDKQSHCYDTNGFRTELTDKLKEEFGKRLKEKIEDYVTSNFIDLAGDEARSEVDEAEA